MQVRNDRSGTMVQQQQTIKLTVPTKVTLPAHPTGDDVYNLEAMRLFSDHDLKVAMPRKGVGFSHVLVLSI